MKVIKGGFKKGVWGYDQEEYSDEDIKFVNEALHEAGQHDPRWLKLIWDVPDKNKRFKPTSVK